VSSCRFSALRRRCVFERSRERPRQRAAIGGVTLGEPMGPDQQADDVLVDFERDDAPTAALPLRIAAIAGAAGGLAAIIGGRAIKQGGSPQRKVPACVNA
jgi:hypothetical protein